jgi:phosphoribosylaminoimidazole-succinocarboxamide synthase
MMQLEEVLKKQLGLTLEETNFKQLGTLYRGKVRDVYSKDDRLVMITSDRVSAFDRVLGTIPFKGEILNRMAAAAFEATKDVLPNHVIAMPDPNVVVGKRCKAYPVEFVVRGYITGSLWRDHVAGTAGAYGVPLPATLKKDQRFDRPILTPTTKAEKGEHDQAISKGEIIAKQLMTEAQFERAEDAAFRLFARGTERAKQRGLILVDTKYELGEDARGELTVIDEIHTPDSSRYWLAEGYEERFARGESQQMLDKENLRGWLMEKHNFSGYGDPPALDDDIRITLATKYAEAYALMVGEPFDPKPGKVLERIEANLKAAGLL